MTFGQKLQNLRKSKNMSQEDLANLLNVSRQAISKWETDQSLPDTTNIIAISEIFSVSTDYLLLDKECVKNISHGNKGNIATLCAIIFTSIGFLGNFIFYILSRFITAPGSVRTRGSDGSPAWTVGPVYDFSDFIAHHNLEFLVRVFVVLFILGSAILAFLYYARIKAFALKVYNKIKLLKHKK